MSDAGLFTSMYDIQIIKPNDKGEVIARSLHAFLESKRDYSNWINYRIKEYGYIEGVHFSTKVLKTIGRPKKEHFLTLEMAKELCMIERTEIGKKARQYFLECEKIARQPKVLSTLDILKLNVKAIEQLEAEKAKLALENTKLANRDLEVKTRKEYKWAKQEVQNDRGRTINYYVNRHFKQSTFSASHNAAKAAYARATGIVLPKYAKHFSMEQKKDYLDWLSRYESREVEILS